MRKYMAICLLGLVVDEFSAMAISGELTGFSAINFRLFVQDSILPPQDDGLIAPSIVVQPEFRHDWNDSTDRFTAIPFARYDKVDSKRSHLDIRELNWLHQGKNWDIRIGLGKVFWGVTESRHLVDIINQTDFVEDINGETKLGQPMINFNVTTDYGDLSFFYLPYFRERTYPGTKGRLRFALPVDIDESVYKGGANPWHQDLALRWSKSLEEIDIGIAHFWGVGREPILVPSSTALIANYQLINQTSLDLQYTVEAWMWKLETMVSTGQGPHFFAIVTGFERTFYRVFENTTDVGLMIEYLYDGRDKEKSPFTTFNNDVYTGLRVVLNDEQDTTMLFGVITDLDNSDATVVGEASRRLTDKWKLEVEARWFDDDDTRSGIFHDDYFEVRLIRYF